MRNSRDCRTSTKNSPNNWKQSKGKRKIYTLTFRGRSSRLTTETKK